MMSAFFLPLEKYIFLVEARVFIFFNYVKMF